MRSMKWLMVPALALLVGPLLGGCVHERYGYYHPAYVRYHHWHRAGGVIVVGSADGTTQPPADVAQAPSQTSVE
jgi:hypothetical protein